MYLLISQFTVTAQIHKQFYHKHLDFYFKEAIGVKWVSDPIIWRKMILIRIMIRGYDLRCSGYKSARALDCSLGLHKLEINSGSSKLGSRAVEHCDPVSPSSRIQSSFFISKYSSSVIFHHLCTRQKLSYAKVGCHAGMT